MTGGRPMTHRLLPLLALAAAVPGAAQGPAPPPPAQPFSPPGQPDAGHWSQLSIHERIVIRVPRIRRDRDMAAPAFPGDAPPRWSEKKGDRCIQAEDVVGASIPRAGSVDFVLDDGQRARALLASDCPALDYYLGFYIRPAVDGRVCAGRDSIRSRSGAVCPIRAFRRLVPAR
jgi:hypothetical protein